MSRVAALLLPLLLQKKPTVSNGWTIFAAVVVVVVCSVPVSLVRRLSLNAEQFPSNGVAASQIHTEIEQMSDFVVKK